ncbi:MAG: 5-formyltetrahydrofolate cyclo-ligase [Gammaproteobacteria bacterium]|jgi:5-formyltetrahydrofolate cyclo-ligase
MNAETDKTKIREILIAARTARSAAEKQAHSERISTAVLALSPSPASVFIYVSLPDEVETSGLINAYTARGATVTVPRIVAGGKMRAVKFPGWGEMVAGPLGILAPRSERAFTGPVAVAIVPGLGFTRSGARIGYGAGYYDRWLAENPETGKIGIAFECQLTPALPQEPHDIPMDHLVTERQVYPVTGG